MDRSRITKADFELFLSNVVCRYKVKVDAFKRLMVACQDASDMGMW